MKDKIIIARKDHKCDACEGVIIKGEKYQYMESRVPRMTEINEWSEKQIGVDFIRMRLHIDNCIAPEECKNGNHIFEHYSGTSTPDGYIEPVTCCINCGLVVL